MNKFVHNTNRRQLLRVAPRRVVADQQTDRNMSLLLIWQIPRLETWKVGYWLLVTRIFLAMRGDFSRRKFKQGGQRECKAKGVYSTVRRPPSTTTTVLILSRIQRGRYRSGFKLKTRVMYSIGDCRLMTLEKIPCFSTENAQKMEYGESTECLYMFSVVSIRLCTKYHRKQVQKSVLPWVRSVWAKC